jgi:hypothetical protein
MESVCALFTGLEKSVFEELDKISENYQEEGINDCLDYIKLDMSSRLTEIRLMIRDKVRLRQLAINQSNTIHMINQKITVMIIGIVKHPSTVRAKGCFAVVWNDKHTLNIVLENTLAVKSKDSSVLLALLAACNQFPQLKIKAVMIMTPSHKIKTIVESLPLWHSQEYITEEGSIRTNSQLLAMIQNTITNNKLDLEVLHPVPQAITNLYDSHLDIAKKLLVEQWKQ